MFVYSQLCVRALSDFITLLKAVPDSRNPEILEKTLLTAFSANFWQNYFEKVSLTQKTEQKLTNEINEYLFPIFSLVVQISS